MSVYMKEVTVKHDIESRYEKTGLRGFRPGPTKPGCTVTEDG